MTGWTQPDRHHRDGAWWLAGDAVLAALFTWITVVSLHSDAYVDQYGPVEGAGWLLALGPSALLLTRRRAPVATLAAATALYLAASASQGDSNAPLALPLFAYSVGLTRPVPVSGAIVGAAALLLSTTTFYGPGQPDPLTIVAWFLLVGAGWLVAVSIRRNRARAEQLGQAVVDLEAHQAQVAAAAVADERTRIARELHDAVGHAVNVMVLQAGAARLSDRRDQAFDALREIEKLGRSALTDLDHMLGLLDDDEAPVRGPACGIADIATMVEEMRSAGSDIELHEDCERPVGRLLGAAVYRIVQEGLTNVVKHAGDAHVEVTLTCSARSLRVRISDDGPGAGSPRPAGGGRGIASMAERAKVLGGQLAAGPAENGGFVVEAVLPLATAAAPEAATAGVGHDGVTP